MFRKGRVSKCFDLELEKKKARKSRSHSEKDKSERENALEICKVLCCFAGYWLGLWKSASPYTL